MGEISWLPLWLRHDFMQNGLLAVVLIAPALAMLGTAVVNNRLAFFSDALGHSAYTGVALGVLLAGWGPQAGLFGFSLLFALLVIAVKNRSRLSPDTVIGIFSSTAIALGLVLMSRGGGFNRFSTYLIGDLLSVGKADLWGLAVLLAVVVGFFALAGNRLLLISVNPTLAASRRVRVWLWEGMLAAVLAAVVALSIRWVGILVINSLLVLPAATARNRATSYRRQYWLAVAVALISGVGGLILSYYWDTATGATVVLVNAVLFGLSVIRTG